MDDTALADREHRGQAQFYRLLAAGHPDSRVVDVAPHVQATVVPATPRRSLPNSVVYFDPAAVLRAHDDLLALYEDAGVESWTVWVRPQDDELVAELIARGHELDGTPAIMGAVVADIDLEPRVALDLADGDPWPVVGALNDAAYGLPAHSLAPTIDGLADSGLDALVSLIDGAPVACAGFHVHDGDCAVELVATLESARGRGLASELLREGLRRARDAHRGPGPLTTTLEGSSMGEPIYQRLGYRSLGRARMLEHRAAAAS